LISFPLSFISILLATLLPVYAALLLILVPKKAVLESLPPFAFGVLLWYFLDTLNDAVLLDVNIGSGRRPNQVSLVLSFLIGLFVLVALSRGNFRERTETQGSRNFVTSVPTLVALGIGFHAVGEGMGVGDLASSTPTTDLIVALGGFGPGAAYVLHKILEATVVAAAYRAYLTGKEGRSLKRIIALGLVMGVPTLIGEPFGYYFPFDSTYFFAMAGGATIYIALIMGRAIFQAEPGTGMRRVSFVTASSVFLGFASMYFAGLLHAP